MGSRYEVEVTLISAKDLKNVNWRHGDLKPYAVLWVDPAAKFSTKVDVDGDTNPTWDEKVTVHLPAGLRIEEAVLSIDIVHANADKDTKPLIGSARVPLRDVIDDVGIGGKAVKSLKLKRPSGRPHGKLDVKIAVREPSRYYEPPPPAAASYGSRDYSGSYGYAQPYVAPSPYGAPPPSGYPYSAAPPSGYPYGAPPPPPAYAQAPAYGNPSYGQSSYGAAAVGKKNSKFGMGTGLAVGAAAGVLGGLALAEGVDYVEDKIADDVTERVEDDLGYDDGGGYGGDDW